MNEANFIPVQSVAQASRLIKEHPPPEAVLMAGGTDLLVRKRHNLIIPRSIIYLKGIPDLEEIRPAQDGGLIIGALATLYDTSRHPRIKREYPILAQAAFAVASPQIRHKATLGGNICLETRCWFHNRSPFWRAEHPGCRKASGGDTCYVVPKSRRGCFALQSGDTVGPLVALGAKLRLMSDEGERIVDVEDFYLGDGIRHLALQPGEILVEVILPPPPVLGAFVKFRPQNNLDFATFTLSVLLPRNEAGSRIVVACVSTRPLRTPKAESMLNQGEWDAAVVARQAVEELKLVSFVRGSVEFKKQVIEAYLSEVLQNLRRDSARS